MVCPHRTLSRRAVCLFFIIREKKPALLAQLVERGTYKWEVSSWYIGSSTLRTGYREIKGDLVLGQIDSIFRVALHQINQSSPPAFCTQTSNQLRRRSPADRHRERTCPRASSALPRARRLPAAAVD